MKYIVFSLFIISCFAFKLEAQTDLPSLSNNLELITDENVRQIEILADFDIQGTRLELVFNPTNTLLATGGRGFDGRGSLYIYSLVTSQEVANLSGHEGAVISLAFNPDGSLLMSGSEDGVIKLWDTESWDELAEYQIASNEITDMVFSTDLQLAVAVQRDRLTLVDMATQDIFSVENTSGWLSNELALNPDNSLIAYGNTGGSGVGLSSVYIFDVQQREENFSIHVSATPDHAISPHLSFSPDGQAVATTIMGHGGHGITTINLAGKNVELQLRSDPPPRAINQIIFSPSGSLIAVVVSHRPRHGAVQFWSTRTGNLMYLLEDIEEGMISTVAFNNAGTLMATVDINDNIKIWGVLGD